MTINPNNIVTWLAIVGGIAGGAMVVGAADERLQTTEERAKRLEEGQLVIQDYIDNEKSARQAEDSRDRALCATGVIDNRDWCKINGYPVPDSEASQ